MYSILKIEIKRAFINKYFCISVIIGLIIVSMQTIECTLPFAGETHIIEDVYPQSVFNSYIGLSISNAWSHVYYMIFPLIAALPYASSYLLDKKSGFIKLIYTKTQKSFYLSAKLIAVFLSGGFAVTLPLLFNLWITALCVPSVIPDISTGFFPIFGNGFASRIYYTHPYVYIAIYNVIIFIVSGVFCSTALALSHFFNYSSIVLVSPFLLYVMISFITSSFSQQSPLNTTNWIFPAQTSYPLDLPIACTEMLIIFVISCCVYYFKGLKDDTF